MPSESAILPGTLLTDPQWLRDRVAELAAGTGCDEPRTNATLWWYSASAVLLGPAVHALVLDGEGLRLDPPSLRLTLRPSGYLQRVVPGPELAGGVEAFGRHLDDALGAVIAPLARIGAATERSLWAIAADSLATRVLASTSVAPGGEALAPGLAGAVAAASRRLRPLPRFTDVDPLSTARPLVRYVRRGSCCLLWRVPEGKCLTCPAQPPAERLERLTRHARG